MKLAFIIGFSYNHDEYQSNNHYSLIRGIIVDLYMIYHYLIKSNYDKIIVVTDIYKDVNPDETIPAVINGDVTSDIFSFIEYLQSINNIYFYSNKDNFVEYLKQEVINANHLLVYYTGHAVQDKLLFPLIVQYCTLDENIFADDYQADNTNTLNDKIDTDLDEGSFATSDFINTIIESVNKNCQILLIIDCCNGSNFNLPFYMDNNGVYHNNNIKTPIYTDREIICIVSSLHDEKSHSTLNGSPFTKTIINNLLQDNKTWLKLLLKSQYDINTILQEIAISNLRKGNKTWLDLLNISQHMVNDIFYIINTENLINNNETWLELLDKNGINLDKILRKQTLKLYSNLPNIHHVWTWLNKPGLYQVRWLPDSYLVDIIKIE